MLSINYLFLEYRLGLKRGFTVTNDQYSKKKINFLRLHFKNRPS